MGIAVAILAADGVVAKDRLVGTVFVGELGLDGRLRSVPGVLPSVAGAAAAGYGRVVVPPENAPEALLVPDMEVVSGPSLAAIVCWLDGQPAAEGGESVTVLQSGAGVTPVVAAKASNPETRDLADVVGQPVARRAAEICAAGGHHMLLLGPPGVGKTMPEIKHIAQLSESGRVSAAVDRDPIALRAQGGFSAT